MKRLVLPLLLAFCFYLESVFTEIFNPGIFGYNEVLVPRFLLILFILMGVFYFRNQTLLYALVFGLIYDVYFTEVIGVYLALYPIAVYITSQLVKILPTNIITTFFSSLFCVTFVEFSVYGLNLFVLQKTMSLNEFSISRLVPTLIVNGCFMLLLYYPFSKLLVAYKNEEMND